MTMPRSSPRALPPASGWWSTDNPGCDAARMLTQRPAAGRAAERAAAGRQELMNISEPFIRRPIATSLLMAALALVGIVAFPLLPVAPLPQVDFPTIQVQRQVPGASPETMAATVAHAARAPVRPDRRRDADDVDQHARLDRRSRCNSISTATSTPPRRTCRPRSPPPDRQLPTNLSSPPTYRKVNPADSADPDPGGAFRYAAADHGRRFRR